MSGTRNRVMVVDDDSQMLSTIIEILEDVGHEVCSAPDGYQAIEMASKEPFGLVFMDISLPGINGVEAYRQIKSVSPGTRVIMMTGFTVEELIRQALEEGAYTVLYKPLDITRLLTAVKDVLDAPCVLVVDDEPDTQAVKLIFADLGYEVALASDGYQAIKHAQTKHFLTSY